MTYSSPNADVYYSIKIRWAYRSPGHDHASTCLGARIRLWLRRQGLQSVPQALCVFHGPDPRQILARDAPFHDHELETVRVLVVLRVYRPNSDVLHGSAGRGRGGYPVTRRDAAQVQDQW